MSSQTRLALDQIADLLKRSKELRLEASKLIKKAEGMEAIIEAAKREAAKAPESPADADSKVA